MTQHPPDQSRAFRGPLRGSQTLLTLRPIPTYAHAPDSFYLCDRIGRVPGLTPDRGWGEIVQKGGLHQKRINGIRGHRKRRRANGPPREPRQRPRPSVAAPRLTCRLSPCPAADTSHRGPDAERTETLVSSGKVSG